MFFLLCVFVSELGDALVQRRRVRLKWGAVHVPAVAAGRRVDADAGNADAGDGESLHG